MIPETRTSIPKEIMAKIGMMVCKISDISAVFFLSLDLAGCGFDTLTLSSKKIRLLTISTNYLASDKIASAQG